LSVLVGLWIICVARSGLPGQRAQRRDPFGLMASWHVYNKQIEMHEFKKDRKNLIEISLIET
jgi:hypothetical protein